MKTYKESQRFSRLPLLFLIPICIIFCVSAIWQVGFGHKVGNHPAPDSVSILVALFICLLTAAFWFARLQTEITEQGIKYGFKCILSYGGYIPWSEVERVKFMRYPYIGEGIRSYSDINAWAYVVDGNDRVGMLIEKKDRKKNILLSTQQITELKQFIKTVVPNGLEITEG